MLQGRKPTVTGERVRDTQAVAENQPEPRHHAMGNGGGDPGPDRWSHSGGRAAMKQETTEAQKPKTTC